MLLVGSSLAQAGDILVITDDIKADGAIHAALTGIEPQWPEQPLRQLRSEDGQFHLSNVPPGQYAIQLFQDSNGNGQLDLSRRGLPLEPVGFSSNPSLLTGKPTPRDSRFEHGAADTHLRIQLHTPKARR